MGYMVQGIFSQTREGFGIGFDETGARAVVGMSQQSIFFAGSFRKESESSDILAGIMIDRVGESQITKIVFTKTRFSFTKRYFHRNDEIVYSFKKGDNNIWEGKWEGIACGRGFAKCVVLPVPDAVFQPPTDMH